MLSFNMASMLSLLLVSCLLCRLTHSFPEQGQWVVTMDKEHTIVSFMKSMYKGSQVSVSISCEGNQKSVPKLALQWVLRRSPCAEGHIDVPTEIAQMYLKNPKGPEMKQITYSSTEYLQSISAIECHDNKHFYIPYYNYSKPIVVEYKKQESSTKPSTKPSSVKPQDVVQPTPADNKDKSQDSTNATRKKRDTGGSSTKNSVAATTVKPKPSSVKPVSHTEIDHQPMLTVWDDGYYLFVMGFTSKEISKDSLEDLRLEVTVRMMHGDSYIAAVDKPLLIFFGLMGLFYIGLGIAWLIMLACNWRDLLRIQFWIGGVILLGMLEKAVFFAEYESVNNTGRSVRGAIILAELVSCLKRALARMLVIIVSLGFGIVKPRLGQTLHKVLIVGLVYMVLASIEGCTRALAAKSDQSRNSMLAAVPLAVTDAIICWWIFSSLLQTTRTLRLRRNIVKLSLFRHFTNTLIFAVLASVAYMIWFLTQHRFKKCLTDWKELWVDDAFWHLLFSVILLIIMILWRPNANNQRYAFSPLLDAAEDDMDDDQVLSEAYEGMKIRTTQTQQRNGPSKSVDSEKKIEDDLKWVEEHIPSSLADKVLPALDSDEEIMNTRFEVSKME